MSLADPPAKTMTTNWLLIPVSILVSLGLVMVYSASIRSWPTDQQQIYLAKHFLFLGLSIVAGCIVASLPRSFWFHTATYWFGLTVILLTITLVPGIGTSVNGSQRWLRFAGFSFQPAELAKWTLPLILARIMVTYHSKTSFLSRENVLITACIGMVTVLVGLEPDLGTALVILLIASITLFIGGWHLRYFILAVASIIPLGFLTLALNPYQWKRIEGMFSALQNIENAPYQVKQSVLALSSGDWTGHGLGNGILKLSFLPEANNDFIFAVVGEEFGTLGTLGILLLWIFFLIVGWHRIAKFSQLHIFATQVDRETSPHSTPHQYQHFAALLAFTLLSQIVLQALINVAVVTAIAPPKGISHPLLSYGGSNLLVTMIMIGLIHALTNISPTSEQTGDS